MSTQRSRPRGHSSNIFINYRREDSSGHAGRLFDALKTPFAGRLFMDVDTLEPGVDFVEAIEQAVGSCEVLIVIIGREWLAIENAAGQRRLDDPADFVRLEVESALARQIRVIPVLVQDAPMPRAEELPPSLARLARRNAIELSDARWAYDVDRLARTIQDILGEKEKEEIAPERAVPPPAPAAPVIAAKPAGSRVWLLALATLVLVAAAALTSVLWLRHPPSGNDGPPPAQQAQHEGDTPAPASPAGGEPTTEPATYALSTSTVPSAGTVAPTAPEPVHPAPASPVQEDPANVPSVSKPTRKPLSPIQVSFEDTEPSRTTVADPPRVETPASAAPATIVPPSPPRVTITSPGGGAIVGATVQVQGTITGLGEQRAFLCIRQKNGAIYPRGELFPAGGQWSIQLRSSKEKTFDVLVVTTNSQEASQALSDQRSRDDGLAVLPAGAAISSGAVALRRQGKIRDLLGSK